VRFPATYIGNDAGIAHLLRQLKHRWSRFSAPRGPRVRIVSGDLDKISAEEVVSAVESLL
jgi:hypothetical protein